MTTIIVVSLAALIGLALVASQLVRLREWLKNSPPLPPPIEDPDDDRN
ncbi:hypothetical protein [Mycolicibacterium mengxianglii]|nr:hypothetical protein [Mycolicibacterium mengxianglii]